MENKKKFEINTSRRKKEKFNFIFIIRVSSFFNSRFKITKIDSFWD